eukprot:3218234-Alexandrium_andersonii.AAC.1
MVARFAQAPEFCCNRVRNADLITSACYVSMPADVGGYVELRPPAGYYVSLASGPPLVEEFPSDEPSPEPWKPVEVTSIWGPGCPGAPAGRTPATSAS